MKEILGLLAARTGDGDAHLSRMTGRVRVKEGLGNPPAGDARTVAWGLVHEEDSPEALLVHRAGDLPAPSPRIAPPAGIDRSGSAAPRPGIGRSPGLDGTERPVERSPSGAMIPPDPAVTATYEP